MFRAAAARPAPRFFCFAGGAPGAECEAGLRPALPMALSDVGRHAHRDRGAQRAAGNHVSRPRLAARRRRNPDDRADFQRSPPACLWSAAARSVGLACLRSGWAPRCTAGRNAVRSSPDTYGPALTWLADEAATLIRINRTEFNSLASPPRQGAHRRDPPPPVRPLPRPALVVTRRRRPGLFSSTNITSPETLAAPVVRQVSATGSGDVMLACILHARYHLGLAGATRWYGRCPGPRPMPPTRHRGVS